MGRTRIPKTMTFWLTEEQHKKFSRIAKARGVSINKAFHDFVTNPEVIQEVKFIHNRQRILMELKWLFDRLAAA